MIVRARTWTIRGLPAIPVILLAWMPPLQAQQADLSRFQHEQHTAFQCAECHSTGNPTSVSNRTWCADCHHVNVGFGSCQRCHTAEEIAPEPLRRLVTFQLPNDVERNRSLTFDHGRHAELSCSSCHTEDASLRVEGRCSSCHEEHHQPGSDCAACHSEPPINAHTTDVHVDLAGCGAAGCHVAEGVEYASMLDERNFCVSCHVGERDHEEPEPCMECHLLGAQEAPRP